MPRPCDTFEIGRLGGRRPKSPSSDDVPVRAGFVGVGRHRFVGFEVQVALDGESQFAAHGAKFDEADIAEFRLAHSEIAEVECEVGAFVDFREEPGALGVRREKLNDGLKVKCSGVLVDRGALREAVGEELFGLGFGDEGVRSPPTLNQSPTHVDACASERRCNVTDVGGAFRSTSLKFGHAFLTAHDVANDHLTVPKRCKVHLFS